MTDPASEDGEVKDHLCNHLVDPLKGVVDCFFSKLDCVYGVQSSMCSCLFFFLNALFFT